MGIREKIIPGMLAHNGTEPDLIAKPHGFLIRLWLEGPLKAKKKVKRQC